MTVPLMWLGQAECRDQLPGQHRVRAEQPPLHDLGPKHGARAGLARGYTDIWTENDSSDSNISV
jgi:hypothetical protein